MYTTVIVPFEYYASHSLSLRAPPHDRHSALKLFVRDTRKDSMVIDILKLRPLTDPYVEKLADAYLNENPVLAKEQAARPTSEICCPFLHARLRNDRKTERKR